MTKQLASAKTPTVAIARVLRGLGLKQGADFSVRGNYVAGERTGTFVTLFGATARRTVADHADAVEAAVLLDGGFWFRVSLTYGSNDNPWPMIANYGERVREADPTAVKATTFAIPEGDAVPYPVKTVRRVVNGHLIEMPAGAEAAAYTVDVNRVEKQVPLTVEQATTAVERTKPLLSMLQQRAEARRLGLSAEAHPYDGKAQRQFGNLTWACQEAGQVWFFQNTATRPRYTLRVFNGRTQINGWYLSGPGIGQAGSLKFMGVTLTIAAMAAEDLITI